MRWDEGKFCIDILPLSRSSVIDLQYGLNQIKGFDSAALLVILGPRKNYLLTLSTNP